LIAFAILALLASASQPKPPDAKAIIERSVQANKADWAASPQYAFDETDFDGTGHTHTYNVTMILGSPYERLIRVDGKPLSSAQQAVQQRKYQQTLRLRRNETAAQRARRVGSYHHERARDHLLMNQLAVAFTFKLTGEQQMGPYKTYVLQASRRRGYNPPNREAQVLTGMTGTLWIDEKTFQWVKVEAHVVRPVTIEGFLAKVEPGTRFELEKTPVGHGVWLKKDFSMHSRAKILYLFHHNNQEHESFSNYRPQNAK
jgi:hypothetical protein